MRVLFVCTGNICRSPFAEDVARREGLDADSAGLEAYAGAGPTDDAIAVARELGHDISSHRARPLTAEMVERADLVVGMTAAHVSALGGRSRLLGEADLDDPIGRGRDVYRRVYAQIERDVRKLLQEHA
jgi:protein-tyrosine-phosphatase